jgi:hypothetical protein
VKTIHDHVKKKDQAPAIVKWVTRYEDPPAEELTPNSASGVKAILSSLPGYDSECRFINPTVNRQNDRDLRHKSGNSADNPVTAVSRLIPDTSEPKQKRKPKPKATMVDLDQTVLDM